MITRWNINSDGEPSESPGHGDWVAYSDVEPLLPVTFGQAQEVLGEMTNGRVQGVSSGKGGRAWLEGEFDLAELEAVCVLARDAAGDSAMGARQLIEYWRKAEGEIG